MLSLLRKPRRAVPYRLASVCILLLNLFFGSAAAQKAPALIPAIQTNSGAPTISKIDPPNWFASLPESIPNPMLLLQGTGLHEATFTSSNPSVHVTRVITSPNGHWAMLWLDTRAASSGTLHLSAHTASGATSFDFVLAPRRPPADGMAGFSSQDVMYLIMTDRFADGDPTNDGTPEQHAVELAKPRGWHGGDLRGIQQHIDYLQDLGVTTVWITPVYQNHEASSYHGYGATDMYSVDEHYGSLEDLRTLASSLHAHHMKLVLDTVPNHVGPAHPWVYDSPDPTWFHGTRAHHTIAQGDFKPLTDPHAAWRDQRDVTQGWFADALPDLNQENPAVAQYLTQNAIWWIEEAGLDGLRLDTFPYIARPFWASFHAQLHALYPNFTTVGEIFNSDPTITSSFAGGVTRNGVDTGLDTLFDFPTYFALRDVLLHDAPMTRLAEVLRLDALYPHPERLVPFLGNHDTSRFLNDPAATPQKLQLAFTILTTMRGMPQIYSGDEIAMRGGDDPNNRQDFPGGFPLHATDSHATRSQPDAFHPAGRDPEQAKTFSALQTLLALRRSHPALQRGDEQLLHADSDVLVYVRSIELPTHKAQRVLVAVNKSHRLESVVLDINGTALEDSHHTSLLLGDPTAVTLAASRLDLRIAPETALIVDFQ